jgi:hypothetical protein
MSKYRTEVIKLPKSLPRVRVIIDYSDTDFHEQYYINTFADLSEDTGYQVIPLMAKWCIDNDCGYRTSYDTFKFRNKHQMMLFLLRWGK